MAEQQVFSGRYELIRHIARGGMAQVYLAKDVLLDRPVALKVLFPELSVDRSFVERFRREAQAAANLSHPNIVSVYDWGQGEHTYFIVMEYVDGHTVSSLIRQGAFDADRAAVIGGEVAAALQFAHDKGVIHRDIKPGNVLLEKSGRAKVADFGIARAAGSQDGLTQTGAVMGTATYFSPEQAQGFSVDARSDIYSLGVVLYEMVVGHPPFAGENPVSIAYQHVREEPMPPTQANPAVARPFEAIVMKAMAKDPQRRYQSAEALRQDLARFREGQTVTALLDAAPTIINPAPVEPTRVQRAAGPAVAETVEERQSHTGLILGLIILLLALAAGLLAFFLTRSSARTLTIPADVVGKPAATAQAELRAAGFTNVIQSNQPNDTVPAGIVSSTIPPAGSRAKSDSSVTLVVSAGPTAVAVPNVVGQDQQTATTNLQAAGFKVNATTMNSDTVAQGLVLSTTPPPGQNAPQGSAVTIVVSGGKQQVQIPSLVGQSSAAAGSQLGKLGLIVTEATEPSATIPAGEVTRTSPPAGQPVPVGSSVTVYVSTGAAVPNLQNQTRAQADAMLAAAGLKGSYTTQPVQSPAQNGLVISQDPPPGTSVARGTTVSVVLGAYTATTTTTSTSVPSTTTTVTSSTTSSTT